MNIEVEIIFDEAFIIVRSNGLTQRFANLIVLELATHKVVDIGYTEGEIFSQNPVAWQQHRDKVSFEPIFDRQNFDPEKCFWATKALVSRLVFKLRGLGIFDSIVCRAQIPNYDDVPTNAKEWFESSIETWNNLKALHVNGQPVVVKGWRYNFAKFTLAWGWRIILASLVIGVVQSLGKPSDQTSALTLLLLFLCFGIKWLTEIVWMLGMQLLFPRKKLRRMFAEYEYEFTRKSKFSVSSRLADWTLGRLID